MIEIREGNPPRPGSYVAYVNDDVAPKLAVAARKMLLHWQDNRWWYPMSTQAYRDHVYGWVGPLPAMPLDD
jgi:hypothetical protein